MKKRWKSVLGFLGTFVIVLILWKGESYTVVNTEEDVSPLPALEQVSPTPNAQGRTSENFRIVEDSTEGFASVAVETNATVTRVKDGDTFVAKLIDGAEVTVRLLGVDTPETVDPRKTVQCFGKEASNFTKSSLQNKRVRLDADPQADERDKYGRLLRNVTLEDGTDYNAFLVKEGYAHAYLSFPLTPARKVELKNLEDEAKAAKKGLWGGVCGG
ncbi:hypothetical protein A3E39_01635 [Candidatus Uhrbacteria bacterium RIFCSPHIGHO2_12_FULL_60_25]|uniref:TNase-like domain-containing protein n=1 Tax=Candidatus Uhrbacteria bacterium RIFCSPHIGHO2_12_FULL_60_25 TaxID=1802399 RepID=A0A1F7ULM7_9BACT|nr:MAG: hypothetical protein A3D73_01805 [Candidatus Uhrbacteria bacterium RIFCSPHIGHO2_02_FULL_60_44]OGL78618.1 MAG: hypothetical protein A3E39_01635 [Candidatus Uhrbacteria bacterium RIFCSPHIGHO2_12_FULL_60_25]